MKIGIVGGAGFIGHHAARTLAKRGHSVVVLDDFSRKGSREHAATLEKQYPKQLKVTKADISKASRVLDDFAAECDGILHLAAQVAVTLSVSDPRRDFEINALGSFNLLESVRKLKRPPLFIYSSTNKVYGGMEDVKVVEKNGRYAYDKLASGVPETQQLDFHSPYGCSKGAADQYVRDYARIYGIPTVVYRQSCIYGAEQYGHEDQGWVAHITLQACREKPIRIYGDGKQVRDVLYIDDLIDLYEQSFNQFAKVRGQVFNIGGGPTNVLSLLELIALLQEELGRDLKPTFHDWRPGDQKVFVCDIREAEKTIGWSPRIKPAEGVKRLMAWIKENRQEVERVLTS